MPPVSTDRSEGPLVAFSSKGEMRRYHVGKGGPGIHMVECRIRTHMRHAALPGNRKICSKLNIKMLLLEFC